MKLPETKVMIRVLLVLVLICVIMPTWSRAQQQMPTNVTLSGSELFIQNRCVRCHTIGRGRFVGPDLSGIQQRYSRQEIIKWIENPQNIYQSSGKMPVNEGYPPMPPMKVPQPQAEMIADYLLAFEVDEDAPESGSISGQVINKTNDTPVAGVEITLTPYMGERPDEEKVIKSDDQGNFNFKELSWDRSYEVSVNYQGAEYSTGKMVFNPDENTKILDLPIYEPTFDEDVIKIIESQMIVQHGEGVLSVGYFSLFDNTGDKMYVGGNELSDGRKESIRFSIPSEAQNVSFIHGVNPDNVVKTDYGYADTTSAIPGQRRVVYAYDLPGTESFEKTIEYPTDEFLLLVSGIDQKVNVEGLTGGEAVQGKDFLKWTGENLKPGHIIRVEFVSTLVMGDYIKFAAIGFFVLIIIAGIIFSSVSKGKPVSEGVDTERNVQFSEEQRLNLIREVAQLDDSYEAGSINEETYKKVRNEKIEELKKITRRP